MSYLKLLEVLDHNSMNGLSNLKNTWVGREHSISTSPSVHPLLTKSSRYNVPDVNKAFNESVAEAVSYKA